MKIKLRQFDLSIDRIIQEGPHYLELNDSHLIYHVECHVEKQPNEDDNLLAPEEAYVCFHAFALKKFVSAVYVDFVSSKDSAFDVWVIEISVVGMGTDIRIKCETQSFATELQDKIINWLMN
jgi:hypothetical protein